MRRITPAADSIPALTSCHRHSKHLFCDAEAAPSYRAMRVAFIRRHDVYSTKPEPFALAWQPSAASLLASEKSLFRNADAQYCGRIARGTGVHRYLCAFLRYRARAPSLLRHLRYISIIFLSHRSLQLHLKRRKMQSSLNNATCYYNTIN